MKPPMIVFEDEAFRWMPAIAGRRPRFRLAGLAALGLATILLAATGWNYWGAQDRLATAKQAVDAARVSTGLGKAKPSLATERTNQEQLRAWNQLARQLNMPWGLLLSSLEQATPEDVALVFVEPEARKGSVRLQAEARSLDALLTYAQALRAVPAFSEVVLHKHETNEADPQRPVRLSLEIRLADTARGER